MKGNQCGAEPVGPRKPFGSEEQLRNDYRFLDIVSAFLSQAIQINRMVMRQKEELLEKYASALGLKRGSDDWLEFFDLAAASRGELPKDLLSDQEVLGKLPLVFRTIRGSQLKREQLDELVEKIRRS